MLVAGGPDGTVDDTPNIRPCVGTRDPEQAGGVRRPVPLLQTAGDCQPGLGGSSLSNQVFYQRRIQKGGDGGGGGELVPLQVRKRAQFYFSEFFRSPN